MDNANVVKSVQSNKKTTNLLLSQIKVSFGNGHRAMAEQSRQLDKGKFCHIW